MGVEGRPAVDGHRSPFGQAKLLSPGLKGMDSMNWCAALLGLMPSTGTVTVDGADLTKATTRQRHDAGLAYIPFDRHREGLMLNAPLWENTLLGREDEDWLGKGPLVDATIRRTPSTSSNALQCLLQMRQRWRSLGGNQQKLIVGRTLTTNPGVLVAAHPTRGIDVGAQAAVWTEFGEPETMAWPCFSSRRLKNCWGFPTQLR